MNQLRYLRPVLYLRASLFWLLFAASIVLFSLILIAVRGASIQTRYQVGRQWNRFNVWWLRISCGLGYRVRGLENVPQDGQPMVFMAKHQSTWETIALATLLPTHTYVLKRELMRIPFFGWGLATMWPIAIDRSAGRKAVEQMVSQGMERIAAGVSVLVFPEGTRTRPGSAHRYKMGGAILAEQMHAAVLPIAHNAGEYWPRHSYIKWPGTIELVIGEPIDTSDMTPEQINEAVQTWIEARMQEISNPELHRRA